MPYPRAEVFWLIPLHQDWQDYKCPINALGGEGGLVEGAGLGLTEP